jgi:hypothetical protein
LHLVEDPPAQQALDEALEKWTGAGVAWEAATWVVLRDPGIGVPLFEGGNIRSFTYEGARSIDQPTITLIYEKVGHETIIRAAKFSEAKYGNAGRG